MAKKMRNQQTLTSLEDTKKLASQIADKVKPGLFLLLNGDLGTGKTTFTKYLLAALGVQKKVSSPTFVIMNEYETPTLKICHLDAYRLHPEEDLFFYLDDPKRSLNIVEWPAKLSFNYQVYPVISLTFTRGTDDQERLVTIERNF